MSPLFTTRKRTAEDSRMEWMVTSKTDDTLQRGTLIGRGDRPRQVPVAM
jgi:hypothetical protein